MMTRSYHFRALERAIRIGAATLVLVLSSMAWPVFAAGTIAGTDIDNIAEATYDTPSGPVTIQSNMVRIKVDELLDATIVTLDPGDITTSPGASGNRQSFRISNSGNGEEAFQLTANVNTGGDDFDPTLTQIVLDSNGNGIYDAGVDAVYVAGSNDPVLQPDQSIIVFVITATPTTVTNGNRAATNLMATAITGSGAPGTTFANAGQGGGNAVVGNTGADADANSFLVVQAAAISLLKSATIADPFGGSRPLPGAVITYSIVATISGAGTLDNVVLTDSIPAGTVYQAGSITFEAAAQTDAVDGTDDADFNGTRVRVGAGNVAAGQTRTVTFRTVIQ